MIAHAILAILLASAMSDGTPNPEAIARYGMIRLARPVGARGTKDQNNFARTLDV
jgi:hypothetical protein